MKKVLLGFGLMILGVFGIVIGEADDAPGAGLLGIIFIVAGIYLIIKKKKKKK